MYNQHTVNLYVNKLVKLKWECYGASYLHFTDYYLTILLIYL